MVYMSDKNPWNSRQTYDYICFKYRYIITIDTKIQEALNIKVYLSKWSPTYNFSFVLIEITDLKLSKVLISMHYNNKIQDKRMPLKNGLNSQQDMLARERIRISRKVCLQIWFDVIDKLIQLYYHGKILKTLCVQVHINQQIQVNESMYYIIT